MRLSRAVCAAAAAVSGAAALVPGADIPPVNIAETGVTVSGISAGAFMAVQMHVIYSSHIRGVGVLAGGPFWCAQDSVEVALTSCMTEGGFIDVSYLQGIMQDTAGFGFVDPLLSLASARVWMMSALNDTVVNRAVVNANTQLYTNFLNAPTEQMKEVWNQVGEHAQLTTSWGNDCTYLGSPYINNCGFDAAGDMLQWLYNDKLVPPTSLSPVITTSTPKKKKGGADYEWRATPHKVSCVFDGEEDAQAAAAAGETAPGAAVPRAGLPLWEGAAVPSCSADLKRSSSGSGNYTPVARIGDGGSLYEFDQGAFVGGGGWSSAVGLAQSAFVFIPDPCLRSNGTAPEPCRLHMAFHGCLQTQDDIGKQYMLYGGYLPWALANNFVVVFPQAISNLLNPKGCFDWWGYSTPAYASNAGVQPDTVKGIMDVLLGGDVKHKELDELVWLQTRMAREGGIIV